MPNKLAEFMFTRVGVPTFGKYLDLTAFRHKLVSGNIANAATPVYKGRHIDFKVEFERLTGSSDHLSGMVTHPGHIPLGNHEARPPRVRGEKITGEEINSVDIDREVSTMAQNELLYTMGARLLQKKFNGLKKVITSK